MRRLLMALCCVSWGIVPAAAQSGGGEPESATSSWLRPTLGAELALTSAYVWRGNVLADTLSTQPSISLGLGRVTLTSWLNINSETSDSLSANEHDLIVGYEQQVGHATVLAAWTNYYFPKADAARHANELMAGFGFGGYVNPQVVLSHISADDTDGNYVEASVKHEYAVGSTKATITPSVAVGYNAHQWSAHRGFSAIAWSVAGTIPSGVPHVAVRPFVAYSMGLADSFPDKLYGGCAMVFE